LEEFLFEKAAIIITSVVVQVFTWPCCDGTRAGSFSSGVDDCKERHVEAGCVFFGSSA